MPHRGWGMEGNSRGFDPDLDECQVLKTRMTEGGQEGNHVSGDAPRVPYGRHKDLRGTLSTPSWRLTAVYALQSIRLRFGRSLITTACVIGAIAFLAYNALSLQPRPRPPAVQDRGSGIRNSTPSLPPDFFDGLEEFTQERSGQRKRLYVVTLALLVALVGITNSMLMSIKERYREIATLKCLGAVNGYIRKLFMLEALIQGGFGAVLGTAFGSLLHALVRADPVSWEWALTVCGGCIGLGMVMMLIASVWPIRAALAMMPIEALRVEE